MELHEVFGEVPTLAALLPETRKRLERAAEQRLYRRRHVIHFPDQVGDFVYVLCSGRVKVSRVSEQGREMTLYLLEGTQLFGETGLAEANAGYELMAETLEDSQVAVLRRADVLAGLAEAPQAAMEMLKLMSDRRTQAETQAGDLVFLEVPRRLAKLLLHLHEAQGGSNGRTASVPLKAKLTHQELANMIGSTRETTTLVLNDFKRQGALDFLGRKIILRDRSALEAVLSRTPLPGK